MIMTFIRSSMLGCYDLCQHKFFIEYGIGIKGGENRSATIGNIVHKVLELLAKRKLAEQNGYAIFEDDLLGTVYSAQCEPFHLTELIFSCMGEGLIESDHKECIDLVKKAITFNNGTYDPRNCNIIQPECSFDFEIKKPWAKYSYETPKGQLEGYLSLKGTVDLVIKHDENTYEIRDYKTGRKWDWAKNKEKTEESLQQDQQLRLYHYAACHIFPDIETILFTIYFIRSQEPFLISFDRKDLPETEKFLEKKYKQILANEKPRLIAPSFKCRFCQFSKNEYKDSGQTTCEFFRDKIKEDGYKETMNTFADWDHVDSYGYGGGKGFRE